MLLLFIIFLITLTGCSDVKYTVEQQQVKEFEVEEFTTETGDLFSVSYNNNNLVNIVNSEINVSFVNPISSGYVFSSPFGHRWGKLHQGVDLAVPEGTAILASTQGCVKRIIHSTAGYGIHVEIEYVTSNGDRWLTRYAHLSEVADIKVGDYVNAGDVIAKSGNTGDSTGPHLHFEIFYNNSVVDPETFIDF